MALGELRPFGRNSYVWRIGPINLPFATREKSSFGTKPKRSHHALKHDFTSAEMKYILSLLTLMNSY